MHQPLRTLLPGQFGVLALFVVMTAAGIVFAVVCQPVPLFEKVLALSALWELLLIWWNRNYLHPLQGTISIAQRRRMAMIGLAGAVLRLPLYILFYVWTHGRHLSFVDVVFGGALVAGLGLQMWKLVRATRPGEIWVNTIEV